MLLSLDPVLHPITSSPDRYPRTQVSPAYPNIPRLHLHRFMQWPPQPLCRNSPATNLASVAFLYLGGLYICFTKVCTKPEPCDQRIPSSIAYWDRNLVPSRSHIYINFPLLLLLFADCFQLDFRNRKLGCV